MTSAAQALPGAALDRLDSFLRGGPALQNQAVGNIVLVDVADVGHRFLTDLLGRYILHVLKPEVGIEPALGGLLAQLRNPARAGIVGSEREQRLVKLLHWLQRLRSFLERDRRFLLGRKPFVECNEALVITRRLAHENFLAGEIV